MSYERDTDKRTRGAGAIAAVDMVSAARHRRRVDVGRRTRQRDRAMAAITNGALGAIALSATRPTRAVPVGKIPSVRPTAAPAPTPDIFNTTGALATGTVHVLPGRTLTLDQVPPPPPRKQITSAYDPTDRPKLVQTPLPPLAPLPPPSAPSSGAGGAATGGGGATSGGTMSGGGGSVLVTGGPGGAPLNLPDLDTPTETTLAADHTTRNLVIAAGAGLAAYFLFFRRKP